MKKFCLVVSLLLQTQKLGNAGTGHVWEQKFHIPFWSIIYLLLKLEFIISNWQCKLQYHINHGPEWNVEFSIPIQTPYKHFDCCWVLKMLDFTKQNFSYKLALTDRLTFQF